MKNQVQKTIVILFCLFIIAQLNAQQGRFSRVENSTSDQSVKPTDSSHDEYCIKTSSDYLDFSVELVLEDSSKEAVIQKAKEKVFDQFFQKYGREYHGLVSSVLKWHGQSYVDINNDDIYSSKKGNVWKINTNNARVQKDAILNVAKAIDNYYRPNTIVLYNPNKFKGNRAEAGEEVRTRLQSAYASSIYKRGSIKVIDRMPQNIVIDENNINVNYYDTLLDIVSDHLGQRTLLNPQIAIIVNDIAREKYEEKGGMHYCNIEIHLIIWNLTTYSLITDVFLAGEGVDNNRKGAWLNAILDAVEVDQLFEINSTDFRTTFVGALWDESNRYYDFVQNGREVILELQNDVYGNDLLTYRKFKRALETKCGIVVDSDNDTQNSKVFKIFTQATSQARLVDQMLDVLTIDLKNDLPDATISIENEKFIIHKKNKTL